jgi:hypothetical protein
MNREDIGPVRLVAIVQDQGSAYYLDDGALIQVPIHANGEVRLTDLKTERDLEHGAVDWKEGFAEDKERQRLRAVQRFLLAAEGAVAAPELAPPKSGTRHIEFDTECLAVLIERWRACDVPAGIVGEELLLRLDDELDSHRCELLDQHGEEQHVRRVREHTIEDVAPGERDSDVR